MITQTYNMDIVNSILSHPDIWKDIAPDVEPFEVAYMPYVLYFVMNDGDGVILFHRFRDSIKIHPNVLPDKRGKAAYNAIDEACQEMFSRGYDCIYAEIDRKLVHVIRCAKVLGFNLLESNQRDLFVRRNLDS